MVGVQATIDRIIVVRRPLKIVIFIAFATVVIETDLFLRSDLSDRVHLRFRYPKLRPFR